MKNSPHLFSQYPLVQFATPFCLGICAVEYGPRVRLVCLCIAGGMLLLVALVAVLTRRLKIATWALLVAMFFAGAMLALEQRPTPAIPGGQSVVLNGVLDGPPEYARDRVYLRLRVEDRFAESVLLIVPGEEELRALDLRYGMRIRVTARLTRTDDYQNPGVS